MSSQKTCGSLVLRCLSYVCERRVGVSMASRYKGEHKDDDDDEEKE